MNIVILILFIIVKISYAINNHVQEQQQEQQLPLPFKRILQITTPPMTGNDVIILQHLINRFEYLKEKIQVTGTYDSNTRKAVIILQEQQQQQLLSTRGVFGAKEANLLLTCCMNDKYTDDGKPAKEKGYKYKLHVIVNKNRSIESNATLYDENNNNLFEFKVRAHGHSSTNPNATWPDYTNDLGINQLSSSGNTPTGLMSFDLNSPEDVRKLYGPYPVNRAVAGLDGNALFLLPNIRNGILLHTGEWPNWSPPEQMPNSAGCLHAWPMSIKTIWKTLVNKCNVTVHENTNGKLPYPYKPQGILSVELKE